MLANLVAFTLENFTLVAFIAAIGFALLSGFVVRKHPALGWAEQFFRWIALAMGATGIYAFITHAFFPEQAAAAIGWQNSPFQFEVAVANLGFGVIAILAFSASFGFRLAAVIGNLCWLWGDAAGHIYQMVASHNFTIGNAGSWFWLDIIYPGAALILLLVMKFQARRA